MSLNDGTALPVKQSKDSSSDSDEGCATWGSRHSNRNIQRGHQPIKRQNSYEEDPEITAQIHLTLADLDAKLTDMNQTDGPFLDDEIPVSIVDVDIPVTTIDEVPVDDRIKELEAPKLRNSPNITKQSRTLYEAIQNKNNNASLAAKNVRPSSGIQKKSQEPELTDIKKKSPSKVDTKQHGKLPNLKSPGDLKQPQENKPLDNKKQKPVLQPDINGKAKTEGLNGQNNIVSQISQSHMIRPDVQSFQKASDGRFKPVLAVQRLNTDFKAPATHGKITQSSVSRFGMKTFVVVPPKPTVTQKPAGSLVVGAIKIDDLGNMVTRRQINTVTEKSATNGEVTSVGESSLGQAKAFWSSAEKQEQSAVVNQDSKVKNGDLSGVSKFAEKSMSIETPKEVIVLERKPVPVVGSKPSFPEPMVNSSLPGEGRDLSFLKPTKRTSSQYVASAIAKNSSMYTTRLTSIQEPSKSDNSVQNIQRFNNESKPAGTPSVGLYKPPITTKPTEGLVPSFAEHKRSQSYPSNDVEKVANSENFRSVEEQILIGTDKPTPDSRNKVQLTTQTSAKTIEHLSKEATSIPDTSFSRQMPTDFTGPPIREKPEPRKAEVHSEPNQTNIFGPVKKFKPVVFKPVQKEINLHSSLMESIQSGEGVERLKKVSDSSNSLKKLAYVDPENEHSALLSAIRAPTNSSRLKKTRSGAATELEQLRKTEEARNFQIDSVSPPPTSPSTFGAPPPPAFCPPPPPAPNKPLLVLPAVGNPEAGREALLEAIRSGSGAQRLKKVPVTQTRRQVNGRLGTIQTTSALSNGH